MTRSHFSKLSSYFSVIDYRGKNIPSYAALNKLKNQRYASKLYTLGLPFTLNMERRSLKGNTGAGSTGHYVLNRLLMGC